MKNNKKKIQRHGALLLATVLCIFVMAGCGTLTQQKATEKATTQQSQQAKPKADSNKKSSGKKDAGKKTGSGKTTGSQSSTNKSANSQTGTNKPSGTQSSTNKPAGSLTGTSKPAGTQSSTNNSANSQIGAVKPGSSLTGANKPSGIQGSSNKPAGSQIGAVKPGNSQSSASNSVDKKELPSITTQPQSARVNAGISFTFKISANGANLKYTWQVDKNDGKGWTDIPDANESSYTLKNAIADQNGWKFRCVVSNDAGKAESAAATLNVESSPNAKQG